MVLHHCRRWERKKLYFHFSVRLDGSDTGQTSLFFTLYTCSISYLRQNFFRRKSVHRKTNRYLLSEWTQFDCKKSGAKCFCTISVSGGQECTFRRQLEHYIVLNLLKLINLGKSVCNVFSLAWMPIKMTADNIARYNDTYTFLFPWNPAQDLYWTARLYRRKLWYFYLYEIESTLKSMRKV
jgi:hypothetical protein